MLGRHPSYLPWRDDGLINILNNAVANRFAPKPLPSALHTRTLVVPLPTASPPHDSSEREEGEHGDHDNFITERREIL